MRPDSNAQAGPLNKPRSIGGLFVEGIDVGLSYSIEAGDFGEFTLAANYQRLLDLFTDTGTAIDSDVNEIFAPKDQMNANLGFNSGRLRLQYNLKWTGSTVLDDIGVDIADFPSQTVCEPNCVVDLYANTPFTQGPITYDAARTGSYFQHDIQGPYRVSDALQIYAGINNLTDADPVLFAENTSGNLTTGLPTDGTTQINQIIGRYAYFGVSFRPVELAQSIFD